MNDNWGMKAYFGLVLLMLIISLIVWARKSGQNLPSKIIEIQYAGEQK